MKFKYIAISISLCAFINVAIAYNALVVDYAPIKESTPRETLLRNLDKYISIIEDEANLDIMVFPEYGLTTIEALGDTIDPDSTVTIPEPSNQTTCMVGFPDEIFKLGCTAQQKVRYVVVNMLERTKDNLTYNTNVVFNRKGALIAKYRKINLYGPEVGLLTPGNEIVTFTTDYSATYGLITCYDILFKRPASDIFSRREVTDVIMTSAWTSEVPFYTSIGVQDGYAKKHGINFLASGYADPSVGHGGSGLYAPGITSQTNIPTSVGISRLRTNIPTMNYRRPDRVCSDLIQPRLLPGHLPTIDSFHTKPMADIDTYTYNIIDSQETSFNEKICKGNVCCNFNITYGNHLRNIEQTYKAVTSQKACGIIACDDKENLNSCGSRNQALSRSYFSQIIIDMTLEDQKEGYFFPVTSDINLQPLRYTYCETAEKITLKHINVQEVVFTGILVPHGAGTLSCNINSILMSCALIASILYNVLLR